MRDNVEAESPEDYFRKSITVPFLYCMLNEMKTRLTELHARTASGLQLVPSIIRHFQQYFSYIVAVSFIGGGNWSTRRKLPTCRKSQTNFIK